MVKNHDAGDVRGLEEVFRSQKLSRVPGPAGDAAGGSARAAERASKSMFGHAPTAVAGSRRDDGIAPQGGPGQGATPALSLDRRLMPERQVRTTASSGGGAALAEVPVAVSAEPPGKRETGRYWTVASVSALVALGVAGVTAGAGQHQPAHTSAQGQHATVRPHDGFHTSGTASTGPSAPGSLTGTVGLGALALGEPAGAGVSVNEPPGHVALSGAATTTGRAVASPGGSADRPPPLSGGSAPAAVAAGVGSAVGAVGSSATGLVSQVGSAVPATTPVTGAVTGVVNTVEQTVDDDDLVTTANCGSVAR